MHFWQSENKLMNPACDILWFYEIRQIIPGRLVILAPADSNNIKGSFLSSSMALPFWRRVYSLWKYLCITDSPNIFNLFKLKLRYIPISPSLAVPRSLVCCFSEILSKLFESAQELMRSFVWNKNHMLKIIHIRFSHDI